MDVLSGMNWAAGAMSLQGVGLNVAAHNVANVSTDGFAPQKATFATGSRGQGVELETVRKEEAPAATQEITGFAVSGTEIAREIPQMITSQRAFEANAATIRAADEMLGTLINSVA